MGIPFQLGIVDDHTTFRQALVHFLAQEPSIEIALEAGDGEELKRNLLQHVPEILLLDIRMPKMNGIDALKFVYENYPSLKVLILTSYIDEVYLAQCLQYGIYGYLSKNVELSELIKAIKQVGNNEMYLTNMMNNQLMRNYLSAFHGKHTAELPHFSSEEVEILMLLKDEKTTEEISHIMNLSKRTIELKRDRMREKANKKTVGGLLMYAVKRGI